MFMNTMIQAFHALKQALINDPYLKLSDFDDEYEITINASEDEATVGAMLI